MIETRNVTKIYKLGDTDVIGAKEINLKIEEGEFLSIMGPSGSGKSTLLYLIGGLDKPTSGDVLIDGVNIVEMEERALCEVRRDKIGFIFQEFNLISTLTAIENTLVPLIPMGVSADEMERGMKLLESFDLKDRIDHLPGQLSGGQQQRVAIARALINEPEIVLADEPTGELDTKSGDELIQLMEEMNRREGVTFIIVTHDPVVSGKTRRTIFLQDGMIVKD
ncbi:MAG: ABC transporter ATP-binding protein [Candidatus Methanolliviera hydrocarbonicum]|uniref:ABC transporter ATP-binding protein n=1 Tax=Candidatus Methanolliviera hydrocarbonicum TaxID=2491085 RepID=A0A520KYW2_9EURY|nr:MAG: ABC transporter ATP-binding protein [Candidatus Methanolliviera hydrocarbonicum]